MQEHYTVDANSNMVNLLKQEWDPSTETWINTNNSSWTYDIAGKMATQITQKWLEGAWSNFRNIIYNYNDSGQLVNVLQYEWIPGSNAWGYYYNQNYSFDTQGRPLIIMGQLYNPSASWTDYQRHTHTYDALGLLVNRLSELKLFTEFQVNGRDVYTYDDSQRLTLQQSDKWSSGQWLPLNRTTSTYSTLGTSDLLTSKLIVYPNPVTNKLRIGTGDFSDNAKVSLIITNMAGKSYPIKAEQGTIDVSSLAAGVYVITIQDQQNITQAKFVKQ